MTNILVPKTTRDIPQRPLARMAAKLYFLGALAWDYADTVCNVAASLHIKETKPLSRAVRELNRDYDRFRNRFLNGNDLEAETRLAILFEDVCQKHFTKLNYGVASDKSVNGLSRDYEMLVKAVQMAMTVIDTMKLYAAECDDWIRKQGVTDRHSILSDHFLRLAILLPQFAGDCYNPNSEARKITAKILNKELHLIDIHDDNGKL